MSKCGNLAPLYRFQASVFNVHHTGVIIRLHFVTIFVHNEAVSAGIEPAISEFVSARLPFTHPSTYPLLVQW